MCVFCPFFDGASGADCTELRNTIDTMATSTAELPGGTRLYDERDPVEEIICIRAGEVALLKHLDNDTAVQISTAGPGELLGAVESIGGRGHDTAAETSGPATLSYIPSQAFRQLVSSRPAIVFNIMRGICHRLDKLEKLIPHDE